MRETAVIYTGETSLALASQDYLIVICKLKSYNRACFILCKVKVDINTVVNKNRYKVLNVLIDVFNQQTVCFYFKHGWD